MPVYTVEVAGSPVERLYLYSGGSTPSTGTIKCRYSSKVRALACQVRGCGSKIHYLLKMPN